MKERIVRTVAGSLVIISVLLALFINMKWMFLAAFVGVNLLQSSFTGFCPLEFFLDKAGVKSGAGNCK